MGGKFEIIIVVIGLAWAIASSVMQKKKAKAAKAARLKAIALDGGVQPMAQAAPTPSDSIFDRLINNLREQAGAGASTDTRRSVRTVGSTKIAGGTVKVRPSVPQMDLDAPQIDDEPVGSSLIDTVGLVQRKHRESQAAGTSNWYADEIEATLKDPRRIREAILLQEILGPPIALRS
jgi:hypothetical protein